jgi:Flp pilus assembly CpaF family ATPase
MDAVEIKHLAKSNLRQTPSRIIVGEVRGDEALYLLRALSTGHVGYGTVHANSAEDALEQLQLLASLTPGIQVSWFGLAKLVAKAIQIVVFPDVFEDGSKKIREIIEVDNPGVEVVNALDTRFRTRCLARWKTNEVIQVDGRPRLVGEWIFPERPSAALELKLKGRGMAWPWELYENA